MIGVGSGIVLSQTLVWAGIFQLPFGTEVYLFAPWSVFVEVRLPPARSTLFLLLRELHPAPLLVFILPGFFPWVGGLGFLLAP